jgi:hypothetical protein
MFYQVLRLILNSATQAVDRRSAEKTHEDTLHCLGTLKRFRTPPQNGGLVEPAIRLCEDDWPLLWMRIELERHRRDGQGVDALTVRAVEDVLKAHFDFTFRRPPMSETQTTLMSACAEHGVTLNAEHVAIVSQIGDGTLLLKLLALVQKFGPQIAAVLPEVMADLVAGNYLGAMMLIFEALATANTPA